MSHRIHYEYDASCEVLIKIPAEGLPKIMRKNNLCWNDLCEQDEQYARAIYLGQGCWERLDTISTEQAQQILKNWGYSPESGS